MGTTARVEIPEMGRGKGAARAPTKTPCKCAHSEPCVTFPRERPPPPPSPVNRHVYTDLRVTSAIRPCLLLRMSPRLFLLLAGCLPISSVASAPPPSLALEFFLDGSALHHVHLASPRHDAPRARGALRDSTARPVSLPAGLTDIGGVCNCTPPAGAALVVAEPSHGCHSHTAREATVAGRLLVARRGGCAVSVKAALAQQAGAAALLLIDAGADGISACIASGITSARGASAPPPPPLPAFFRDPSVRVDVTLPVAVLSACDGAILVDLIAGISAEAGGDAHARPRPPSVGAPQLRARLVAPHTRALCPASFLLQPPAGAARRAVLEATIDGEESAHSADPYVQHSAAAAAAAAAALSPLLVPGGGGWPRSHGERRRRYMAAARIAHPDRAGGSDELFAALTQAYEAADASRLSKGEAAATAGVGA